MDAVLAAAAAAAVPEENLHREYFSVPDQPDFENFPFELLLRRSGKRIAVTAEKPRPTL